MNIAQAFTAIDYCRKAGFTLHLIGKHGIGKSSIVYQYAKQHGYEVVEIRVGQMADAGDLIGLQQFIKLMKEGATKEEAIEATKHILPEWFMKATVPGAKVIIFIDELNRGHKDLLQAIFELVYDRSLKGVKINDESFIVSASNPPTGDYSTLDFKDAAFQDRFVHVKLEPTVEEFVKYIRAKAPKSSVGDYISETPKMLENQDLENFSISDFVKPSRRSWDRITVLEAVGVPEDIELELFMGIVGEHAALNYRTFRATNFKSLKADIVLNDYKKARKDVLKAIEKNQKDLLGTLNDELGELLKGMDGLTMNQADNLASLAEDLPVEHGYTLGIIAKQNSSCTLKITDPDEKKFLKKNDAGEPIDYKSLGLFAHKRFVDRILSIKAKRDEMKGNSTQEEATTNA